MQLGAADTAVINHLTDWPSSTLSAVGKILMLPRHVPPPTPPVPLPDVRAAYPNLTEISIKDEDADVDVLLARFPITLESANMAASSSSAATAFVRQLGKHGSTGLPRLRHVTITVADGTTGAVDLRPLVNFSSTLETVVVVAWGVATAAPPPAPTAQQLWSMEDAVAQLTSLVYIDLSALPTARCLLDGAHTRLRELYIGGSLLGTASSCGGDDRAGSRITLRDIAAACPRLASARGRRDDPFDRPAAALPEGWRLEYDGCLRRPPPTTRKLAGAH